MKKTDERPRSVHWEATKATLMFTAAASALPHEKGLGKTAEWNSSPDLQWRAPNALTWHWSRSKMAGYPGGFGGRFPSVPPYGGQPPPQPGKTLQQLTRSPASYSAWFLVERAAWNSRKSGRELVGCLAGDVCRVIHYRTVFWICSSLLLFAQYSFLSPSKGSVSRCFTDVMSQSSSFVIRNVLFSSFGHW